MPSFSDLGLSAPIAEAVRHLGYETPTPIQEQAIPELLGGRDVIGQAQTGTGKTAAFGLPLLEYVDPGDPEVQALVLTPTRELCIQVTQAIRAYGERRGVGVVAVFGGAPIRSQVAQLKAGAQVVVGTVGRVMDLMSRHQLVVSSVRFVVLDEADEMLDLGFLEDVETILSRAPGGRQTALFSATMPPEIRRLAEARMLDPVMVKVRAATLTIDTVEHFFVEAGDREKPEALARVIESEKPTQAIVFVRTKIGVDRLARVLDGRGIRVKALHGDMSPGHARRRDDRLQGRPRAAARGHRRGRARPRHLGRHARHQLRPAELSGDLRPPDRSHRARRALGTGHHRHHRQAAARPRGHRATRVDLDRRVGAGCGGEGGREAGGRGAGGGAGGARRDGGGRPGGGGARARCGRRAARAGRGRRGAPGGPMPEGRPPRKVAPPRTRAPRPAVEPDEERPETRRPRHTKPYPERNGRRATLIFGAGRLQGLVPADLVGAIVDRSRLEGEEVTGVRVLDRYALAHVPAARAEEVVEKVRGHDVRGVALRLEVAGG